MPRFIRYIFFLFFSTLNLNTLWWAAVVLLDALGAVSFVGRAAPTGETGTKISPLPLTNHDYNLCGRCEEQSLISDAAIWASYHNIIRQIFIIHKRPLNT